MPEPYDTPIPHCPHCLREVGERSHFCDACGMPISAYSTIGPIESVWALGWMVNRLLSQPPTAFTVAGVWFLALPSLVMVLIAPLTIALAGSVGSALTGVASLVLPACYLLLSVRVTLSYLGHWQRGRRDRESV